MTNIQYAVICIYWLTWVISSQFHEHFHHCLCSFVNTYVQHMYGGKDKERKPCKCCLPRQTSSNMISTVVQVTWCLILTAHPYPGRLISFPCTLKHSNEDVLGDTETVALALAQAGLPRNSTHQHSYIQLHSPIHLSMQASKFPFTNHLAWQRLCAIVMANYDEVTWW